MVRKRIGVILAQADESTQSQFMEGFLENAFEMNYDVCVFSMYLKYQETPLREVGESNIYNLIQYDKFDAFVVMLDTLQTTNLAENIQQTIKKNFSGPVIIIDRESDLFPSIMVDHYTPVVKLVDHLIEEHGCRNIVFLNGKKGHIHSEQRLRGYMDSMKAHNLHVDDSMIYQGTYWYDSGDDMVDEILADREHMPEAIACANDCMAIGVASRLEKNGVRVPEDIKLIGYDSTDEGRFSPAPLTSAYIPAKACGKHAALWVDAELSHKKLEPFDTEINMFIGRSCGCEYCRENVNINRKTWDTDASTIGISSAFNRIMDDLLSDYDFRSFFNTVFQYTYQIRDFDSMSLCLNEGWDKSYNMIGENALRHGYSPSMFRVISCGPNIGEGNRVDFSDSFDTTDMIPELYEPHDKPKAYIFTPLCFDDRCFGYAMISYGNEPRVYDDNFRSWILNVTRGLEAYFRQDAFKVLLEKVESNQVRDDLTGLYNYKGFSRKLIELIKDSGEEDREVIVTSIDMNSLKNINARHGRKAGDNAIIALAQIINDVVANDEVCTRMTNDEFVIASFRKEGINRQEQIDEALITHIIEYNENAPDGITISICSGSKTAKIGDEESLEHLVNEAISIKNFKKQERQRNEAANGKLDEDALKQDALVKDILDNNRFLYYFQPIVSAKTGSIFAYEALMRADVAERISPPAILESADRMNRLYDIEKATFFNVLDVKEKNPELFKNKKVFINSIPGYQLDGEDRQQLQSIMQKHNGEIVVEFTEETEIDDERLRGIKENYETMNIETAIDDYGSGYSNVNNLLRYMPKYVKIDRMLLTDIHNKPQKQHFVKDIIEFAHDNDIITLAEGVETTQELREIIRLGVDLIQGYYTAKPSAEVIQSIDENIVYDIVQYNQNAASKYGKKKVEIAGEKTVSLVSIAVNKINEICLKSSEENNDIEIIGAPGFQSNAILRIEDGYCGKITIKSVSFAGTKGAPCIVLGEDCDIELELVGDNELRTGGIQVPESSRLCMKGDGNIEISISSGKCYGIGNDLKSRHGKLVFEQDGAIVINTSGMWGIGIGSGLGGDIDIQRGRYEISMVGQDGVAIGSIEGAVDINLLFCDIEIDFAVGRGSIVGSYKESARVKMENLSLRMTGSGNAIVGIGTFEGDSCEVHFRNGTVNISSRSIEGFGIGGKNARTDIFVEYASLKLNLQGKHAYSFGNDRCEDVHIRSMNSAIASRVANNMDSDIGAKEDDVIIENGSADFSHNGVDVIRLVSDGRL